MAFSLSVILTSIFRLKPFGFLRNERSNPSDAHFQNYYKLRALNIFEISLGENNGKIENGPIN